MQKGVAVISTLFRCGIVGGLYGVVLGVIYAWLLGVSGALCVRGPEFLVMFFALAVVYGSMLGCPAGFVSGVLGASLGGPVGYSIGGFVGTGAVVFFCFGRNEPVSSSMPFTVYPSIW